MRTSLKVGTVLALVGTFALSSCGGSESSNDSVRNAAFSNNLQPTMSSVNNDQPEQIATKQIATTTSSSTTSTIPPGVSMVVTTTVAPSPAVSASDVSIASGAKAPLTSVIKPTSGAKNLKWTAAGGCTISGSNLVARATAGTCSLKLTETVTKKVNGKKKNVTSSRTASISVS